MNTRLLISVRNSSEAIAALEGGADVIDFKEPNNGAMGRPNTSVIEQSISLLNHRSPISVALGELKHFTYDNLPDDINYLKFGLSPVLTDWQRSVTNASRHIGFSRCISVLYADFIDTCSPNILDLIQWTSDHGAGGVMVDTYQKNTGNLFHWLTFREIEEMIGIARDKEVLLGFAGSLSHTDIIELYKLKPDLIGVRGAACVGCNRTALLSLSSVKMMKASLSQQDVEMGLNAY